VLFTLKKKLGMAKQLCLKCEKRETCKFLCKKAEKYVNQDYVPQSDIRESDLKKKAPGFRIEDSEHDFRKLSGKGKTPLKMTDREMVVSILLKLGFPQQKIRNVLKMRDSTFNNILYLMRRKIKKSL